MRMAESLLNPILGESNFSRDDYDIESKVFYDPWPAGPKQPDQSKWQAPVIFRVVHMLQKELTASPNPCTTLGCYEALLRLSHAYPPVHLPRGWGCNIPRIRKMSTGVLSGPGLNRSFPNPGFELVVSAVKCLSVNTLSLELVTHGKLLSLAGRLFSGLSMELLRTSSSTLASSDSAGASDASYLVIILLLINLVRSSAVRIVTELVLSFDELALHNTEVSRFKIEEKYFVKFWK